MASTATIVEVELHGYSDNPVYDEMCHKLAYLAGLWRRHKTDEIAHQYQTLLRALIILGFVGAVLGAIVSRKQMIEKQLNSAMASLVKIPN